MVRPVDNLTLCRRFPALYNIGSHLLFFYFFSERKNVFKECPKLVVLRLVSRNNQSGKEFHGLGQSTENVRRPHEFRRTNCGTLAHATNTVSSFTVEE